MLPEVHVRHCATAEADPRRCPRRLFGLARVVGPQPKIRQKWCAPKSNSTRITAHAQMSTPAPSYVDDASAINTSGAMKGKVPTRSDRGHPMATLQPKSSTSFRWNIGCSPDQSETQGTRSTTTVVPKPLVSPSWAAFRRHASSFRGCAASRHGRCFANASRRFEAAAGRGLRGHRDTDTDADTHTSNTQRDGARPTGGAGRPRTRTRHSPGGRARECGISAQCLQSARFATAEGGHPGELSLEGAAALPGRGVCRMLLDGGGGLLPRAAKGVTCATGAVLQALLSRRTMGPPWHLRRPAAPGEQHEDAPTKRWRDFAWARHRCWRLMTCVSHQQARSRKSCARPSTVNATADGTSEPAARHYEATPLPDRSHKKARASAQMAKARRGTQAIRRETRLVSPPLRGLCLRSSVVVSRLTHSSMSVSQPSRRPSTHFTNTSRHDEVAEVRSGGRSRFRPEVGPKPETQTRTGATGLKCRRQGRCWRSQACHNSARDNVGAEFRAACANVIDFQSALRAGHYNPLPAKENLRSAD